MDKCPSCGARLAETTAECPSCGCSLSEVTASFQPVGQPDELREGVDVAESAMLIVRKGPEVGERFYVDRPRLTLGRDPASDIFLNDITVSRSHASLELADGEVTIIDSGSLNGTYVNGVSVERAPLKSGDSVQIGRFQMVFLAGEGA